jgi:hypothetical protein
MLCFLYLEYFVGVNSLAQSYELSQLYDQKDNSQSVSFLHPLLLIQLKIILKFDIVNLINVY